MKLTIVIPLYNAQRHIPSLLRSLNSQRGSFEVVAVDDGSRDETFALLQSAVTTFPMQVIHQDNGGVGSARNAGARLAKGEYITFVDVDDLPADGYAAYLTELVQRHEGERFFRFGFARAEADCTEFALVPGTQETKCASSEMMKTFLKDPKKFGPYGCVWQREFFLSNALWFKEGMPYYEDYEQILRSIDTSGGIIETDAVVYAYRKADASAMSRFDADRIKCFDRLETTLKSLRDDEAGEIQRDLIPRLYWSVLWQSAMALGNAKELKRFIALTGGRDKLKKTCKRREPLIALTSVLALTWPGLYMTLARKKGASHSLVRKLGEDEKAELFRALEEA